MKKFFKFFVNHLINLININENNSNLPNNRIKNKTKSYSKRSTCPYCGCSYSWESKEPFDRCPLCGAIIKSKNMSDSQSDP